MEKMEVKTFKDLDTKQKIQYIWDYYRKHIIIGLFAIIFVVSVVSDIRSNVNPLLSVIMINSDPTKDSSGFDEFFDDKGIEKFDGMVTLSNTIQFDENATSISYNDYAVMMTRIHAGTEDIFFGTGTVFENYADEGCFSDLNTILSEEDLEKYTDCLMYSTAQGNVESYPCAIKLSSNSFLTKNGYYPEGDVYVGLLYNAPNRQLAIDFINYILD